MQTIGSKIKILFAILTIILGASVNTTTSFAQPTPADELNPTCSPGVWDSMVTVGVAKAQHRTVIAQSVFTKPDKTADMTCLMEQLLSAAATIGAIFTDNPQFSGGCAFGGGMIQTAANTIGNALIAADTARNLGGGILDDTSRTEMLTNLVARAAIGSFGGEIAGAIGGFVGGLLGGGCLGDLVGGMIESVANAIFDQIAGTCDSMDTVWSGIAMKRVDRGYFQTMRQLQESDPRTDVAGIPMESFLTSLLAERIIEEMDGREYFGQAIDLDINDVLANIDVDGDGVPDGVFPADHFTRLAPFSETGDCNALPIIAAAGFIACNAGCEVRGTWPALECCPIGGDCAP